MKYPTDDEIYKKCKQIAEGKITTRQYNYWMVTNGVKSEDALDTFKRKEDELNMEVVAKYIFFVGIALMIAAMIIYGK